MPVAHLGRSTPSLLLGLALMASACDQHLAPSAAQASGQRGTQTLTLEVDPLTLDFPATLMATGAAAGDQVTFVRGASLGSGPCPAVLGGLCVDLTGAAIVGRATADADGVARLVVTLPGALGARDVALQAVIGDGADSRTSAAVLAPTVSCTHVPAQHPTLQAAIDAASAGDHICAAAGTYTERIDLGGKSLVLLGEDAATTIIDGGGASPTDLTPVVEVSGTDDATRVSRFTITGGHNAEGAGIHAESSDALLSDLVVTGNSCDVPFASSPPVCQGTGIYAWAGRLRLRDVQVTDNLCDITTAFGWRCEGTGLYAELGAPTLERVVVADNTQLHWRNLGAGMYLLDADATLLGVEVSGNLQDDDSSSSHEGAGVWIGGDGDVAWSGGSVHDNEQRCDSTSTLTCSATGTGIRVEGYGGLNVLSDLSIVDNQVAADSAFGTGLHAVWSDVELADVEIARNAADVTAGVQGVGVFLQDATLTGDRVTLASNSGTSSGATGAVDERVEGIGLHLDDGSAATLTNTVIVDNRGEATDYGPRCEGGGVFTDGALVLHNALVANNHCDHVSSSADGGGLYLDFFDADVELVQVDIVGNTATGGQGEGVHVSDGTTLVVENSSISDPVFAFVAGFAAPVLDARYSNFWGPVVGWTSPAGADGNIAVDPDYVDVSGASALDWDLHLAPSSVLVDAGDPVVSDTDGTRADMGAYGGPNADLPL